MELEDLKKGWKEMEARIDQLEGELKMERHKRTLSVRERLERKYRILGIICILTPCLFRPMMGALPDRSYRDVHALLLRHDGQWSAEKG